VRRVLHHRDRIIDAIGLSRAFPALHRSTGLPAVLRPGDDETRTQRVGWPAFFKATEERGLVFVCDDERFDCAFVSRAQARRAGPRARGLEQLGAFLRALPVVHQGS
jgi:hypothetical protein